MLQMNWFVQINVTQCQGQLLLSKGIGAKVNNVMTGLGSATFLDKIQVIFSRLSEFSLRYPIAIVQVS